MHLRTGVGQRLVNQPLGRTYHNATHTNLATLCLRGFPTLTRKLVHHTQRPLVQPNHPNDRPHLPRARNRCVVGVYVRIDLLQPLFLWRLTLLASYIPRLTEDEIVPIVSKLEHELRAYNAQSHGLEDLLHLTRLVERIQRDKYTIIIQQLNDPSSDALEAHNLQKDGAVWKYKCVMIIFDHIPCARTKCLFLW